MGTTGWYPTSSFIEVDCINPIITASGPLSFCQGDSVILSVNSVSGSNIQWFRNGVAIAGATGASYTAKSPGRYFAAVSDAYCAISVNTSTIRVRIPCLPPFDNQDKLSSSLTNTDIFLNYDSQQQQFEIMATDLAAETYNLLIADATGRILLNENSGISNNSIYRNIDCSTFAKGLYIVKIVAGDKILSRKFVKER
ncbi:MAG: T9SS type A sorting domain-containing protein [Bacteroidetes bacterium]|nr:T9SS type A sorting domain-containing protein [Bacteroidota bacterium]